MEGGAVKIVTYNVNGLRPRIAQYGSLLKLLNSFQADIICFQETKLWREEITADLIMAEGYETFFSCTCTSGQGRSGYSGVATFCRVKAAFSSNEVALPICAEEGFTGLLEYSRRAVAKKKDFLLEIPTKVEGVEGMTKADLLGVDSEGRCIITDHGHFVLFNIYGPRAGCEDTERIDFKLKFYKILQKRWESFLGQGKRVIVVGDLNIAPAAIDRCDAGPDFENNEFRKWLRSLLVENGGPFFDVFRAKHPQRKEAYTCWSMNTGAEEFNYGSRIDHILIAGPCLHQNDDIGHNFVQCNVNDCDIMSQFKRWKPEHIPRWKGGRNVKLEGSDHAPVYVSLKDISNIPQHNTPSLAARYDPKVHGSQQTIATLLSKRQLSTQLKSHTVSEISCGNIRQDSFSNFVERSSQNGCVSEESPDVCSSGVSSEVAENRSMVMLRNVTSESMLFCSTKNNKKARRNNSTQLTLGSYFQKRTSQSVDTDKSSGDVSFSQQDTSKIEAESSPVTKELNSPKGIPVGDDPKFNGQANEVHLNSPKKDDRDAEACCSVKEKNSAALLEWQRIQEVMKKCNSVPLCKGHGEPCVARVVKKEGSNFGRKFYVCNRSEGPSSNPETNCNYFKWEASKSATQKQR